MPYTVGEGLGFLRGGEWETVMKKPKREEGGEALPGLGDGVISVLIFCGFKSFKLYFPIFLIVYMI